MLKWPLQLAKTKSRKMAKLFPWKSNIQMKDRKNTRELDIQDGINEWCHWSTRSCHGSYINCKWPPPLSLFLKETRECNLPLPLQVMKEFLRELRRQNMQHSLEHRTQWPLECQRSQLEEDFLGEEKERKEFMLTVTSHGKNSSILTYTDSWVLQWQR